MNKIFQYRLTKYFLITLSLIFFISKPSYSAEDAVLLAMKLECSGNSAGRKPYNDYFFALTTDHTFQGNRYWIGKNKYEGDIGIQIYSGVRTDKSLLIKGEGKWIKKTSKDWKFQFISKGNKSMFEHLEAGIEGFEGKDKYRRECKLVLLNKVKAGDAIQLNSYIKIIERQKKEIKTYNDTYEKDIEDTKNKYSKDIENLDKQIALLIKQNDEKSLEIKKLDEQIKIANNDKELENEFLGLQNQLQTIQEELSKLESINAKLNKENTDLKDKEKYLENKILLADEKRVTEEKAKEQQRLAEEKAAEEKRLAEEKAAEEKRLAEEKAAEEKRIAEEKAAEEKRIAEEKAAEEKTNKKLFLFPEETELEKAQIFLDDVEKFIKKYPDEFDIIQISEFFIETRPIIDGKLNSNLEKKLIEFKEFLNSSSAFKNYFHNIEQKRQEEILQKSDQIISELQDKIKELKDMMVSNPTSLQLKEWKDNLEQAQITLDNLNSYDDLLTSKNQIIELLNSKKELENIIESSYSTIDELKDYLQKNITSEFAPLILDQIKSFEEVIDLENIEKITNKNEEAKKFIYENFIEPEKIRLAEEQAAEAKKIEEEQNYKLEEIYQKFGSENDYQEQIIKLISLFEIPFEKIEFSNFDNDIKIYGIGDKNNGYFFEEIEIIKVNDDYLKPWLEFSDKFYWILEKAQDSDIPLFEYKGKFFDEIKIRGFSESSEYGPGNTENLRIDEIAISNFDIKEFENIKKLISFDDIRDHEKNILSFILSMKFDKMYLSNISFKGGIFLPFDTPFGDFTTYSDEYELPKNIIGEFEITNWNELSFDKLLTKDLIIQQGENQFSFNEFLIEEFQINTDFTYDLLKSKVSQQLLLNGDYSEIFNSFDKLDNFQISNLKIILNNLSFYSLDSFKIKNLIFDYFGNNKDIKVPVSLNFEINGSQYNYMNLSNTYGIGTTFFDILAYDLGYDQIKLDLGAKWNWDTIENNISLGLNLGVKNAGSIELSTDIVDLDTNILNTQGSQLDTYLLTEPKIKYFDISLIDNSFMDKIIAFSAKDYGRTVEQHKDFLIQSINLYSTTLGIDQVIYGELISAIANFISESDKIKLEINPKEPVSVNDLIPDIISQNYKNLNEKLNLSIRN